MMNNMARMEARWADPEVRYFSDYSEGIKRAPRVRTGARNDDIDNYLRKLFDITPSIKDKGVEVKTGGPDEDHEQG